MDLSTEKLDLINWLAQLTDEEIILKIKELKNESADVPELTVYQKELLEEGLRSYLEDPENVSSWEEVKSRILSR